MSDRVRVLCVIGSMGAGGSERQMIGLLSHLDRTRLEPLLYTIYAEGPLLAEVPDDVPVFSFGKQYEPPRLNWPGRLHGMQVRHLANTIRQQQIDLIYDRTYHAALVAGPAAQRTRVPQVSVVVNSPESDLQTAGRFVGVKRRMLRKIYARAARVLTVSTDLQQEVVDYYGLPTQQVTAMPNGLDLARIDRLAAEACEPLEPQRFHVVCIGRLQPQKGYPVLIDAVDDLVHHRGQNSLCVHLIGDGPDGDALRSLVAERRLTDHVRFVGRLSNPYPMLRQAQLFCLPSLFEGMPNVVLEAMACRTPVLSTDCPTGPREVLDEGRLGCLIPPGDAAALADGIESALCDDGPWADRVDPARQHIEHHYDHAVRIKSVESLLLDVVGRCEAPGR